MQHATEGSAREPAGPGELTELNARSALATACIAAGISDAGARLIRIGSNAVFRVGRDVIARVGRSAENLRQAQKQIAVATWLEQQDYPAARALHVDQPVVAEGRVVTFWHSASDREEYAPIADVARLIRQLHELPPPTHLQLPELQPFGHINAPLPHFPGLSDKDAGFLTARLTWARQRFHELPFTLPPGPVHGDANVGNVILDRNGQALLIDLDSFAVGPREWDLIQTALFYDRFGWHSRDEYETFVDVYGFDIIRWDGYRELADMREIAMTVWLSGKVSTSPRTASEAAKRISAIRTGGSRRDWSAY
jgi:aminoglycoside phosphotransferase (APT) family kinase protein